MLRHFTDFANSDESDTNANQCAVTDHALQRKCAPLDEFSLNPPLTTRDKAEKSIPTVRERFTGSKHDSSQCSCGESRQQRFYPLPGQSRWGKARAARRDRSLVGWSKAEKHSVKCNCLGQRF